MNIVCAIVIAVLALAATSEPPAPYESFSFQDSTPPLDQMEIRGATWPPENWPSPPMRGDEKPEP